MICPKCGVEILDNSKHCNRCGVPITNTSNKTLSCETTFDEVVQTSPILQKKKLISRKQIIIIVLVLLALLTFGIGGYIIYMNTPEQRAIVYAKQQASNMADTMKDSLLTTPDKVILVEKQSENVYTITFSGTYDTWPDSYPKDENPDSHRYNAQYCIDVRLNSNNNFSLVDESMTKLNQIF